MIFQRFFFFFFIYTYTSFFLVVSAARGHACLHCKYCLQSIQRKWSIVNHRNNLQLKLPLPFTCVRVCFLFFSLFLPVYRVIIAPSGLPELPECFYVTPSFWLNNTMVNNVGKKNEKREIILTGSEHDNDAALLGNCSRLGTKQSCTHTSHVYKLQTQSGEVTHQRHTQNAQK